MPSRFQVKERVDFISFVYDEIDRRNWFLQNCRHYFWSRCKMYCWVWRGKYKAIAAFNPVLLNNS